MEVVTVPATGFRENLQNHIKDKSVLKSYQITSFAEKRGLGFAKNEGVHFTRFNSRVMSRIYPDGLRFDSSNYNPMPYWYCGAQVVALNYQTFDLPLRLNEGKYCKNGHTGYIRKPHYLRYKDGKKNRLPRFKGPHRIPIHQLNINLISAWRLAEFIKKNDISAKNLYLRFQLYSGLTCETKWINLFEFERKDKQNLFRIEFNKQMTFRVHQKEIDILLIEFINVTGIGDVTKHDKDNAFLYYSIPVDCIREGYRTVQMKKALIDVAKPTDVELLLKIEELEKKNGMGRL